MCLCICTKWTKRSSHVSLSQIASGMFTSSPFKPIIRVFLHSKLLCSSNLSVIREGTKSEKENKWTGRRFGIVLRLGINFNESWFELSFCEGLFEKISLNSEVMRCYLRTTHEKYFYSISLTLFVKIVVSFANPALQFSSACTATETNWGWGHSNICITRELQLDL